MPNQVQFLHDHFSALANPVNARAMAAYMKTDMPFFGIKKPDRVPVLRQMDKQFPIKTRSAYVAAIEALWEQPQREMKYAALHVAVKNPQFIRPGNLPLYRRLIVEGAWWDFVDEIAIRLVGRLTCDYPTSVGAQMDRWIEHKNMWIRRSAIISHNKHRDRTNQRQLFRHCLRCAPETEFFVRKAIGWALREYAYTAPRAVGQFLCKHRSQLSTLSFREAAKHLRLD